jgi:hypothetical protein
MVEAAKDRMRDNAPEPLDCACARRVLPERNMGSGLIVIGGASRKNAPKMLFIEHNEMVGALASDRSD